MGAEQMGEVIEMTKKMLRIGGTISPEEKIAWGHQMKTDGFRNLWTWICWVIRQHIKESQK